MSTPDPPRGRIIVDSAAAYAAAFLLTTVLHELAHFIVAGVLGRHPVLFHNSVQGADASPGARIATSLAGPMFSALQGVVLTLLEPRLRRASPGLRLPYVWFAFHGLMNGAGYLFTTAFVPDADLGSAARLLGVPFLGCVALTILGFFTIRIAAKAIYPGFVALLPEGVRHDVERRNRGLVQLTVLAWPLGVLLVLPASFPVPHWISLLYVGIAGIGAVWFTDFSKAEGAGPSRSGQAHLGRLTLGTWLLWAALVALAVGVLRAGVPWPSAG